MILEPRLIAVEYMKTWFFLDLLSSLPVDYIFLVLDSGLLDTNLVSLGDNKFANFETVTSSSPTRETGLYCEMGNTQYFHRLSFYGIGKGNCLTL